jgi:hypothetical protein
MTELPPPTAKRDVTAKNAASVTSEPLSDFIGAP